MRDTIDMAREAGIQDAHSRDPHPGVMAQLEHFAELVRADERNQQPAVPDAFGTREGEHPEYIQGWNDCRQAMLAA